jgi:hypothetical protein
MAGRPSAHRVGDEDGLDDGADGDLAKNIAKRGLILAEAEPMTTLTRSVERWASWWARA